MKDKNKKYINIIIIILSVIFFAIMIFWITGIIRTTSPRMNYLIFVATLPIPLLCSLLVKVNKWKLRYLAFYSVLSLATIMMFFIWLFMVGFWIPDVLKNDIDYSFELIKTEKLGDKIIRIYRTNGGMTTDFGIIVREEITLFPGVCFVKQIGSKYHASDAIIYKDENGKVIVVYDR